MRAGGLEVMIGNCGQDTWGGMLSRSRWGVLFLGGGRGKGKGEKDGRVEGRGKGEGEKESACVMG